MSAEGESKEEINSLSDRVEEAPGMTLGHDDGRGSFSSFEKLSVNESSYRGTPDPQCTEPGEAREPGEPNDSQIANSVSGMKELKELEEVATKAAVATRGAAIKFANEAKAFMSSIWSAFDDPEATASSGATHSEGQLAERLGLDANEAILETFRCKLIQRYQSLNGFTPPKNIAFSGQLHVTARHIVFELDNPSQVDGNTFDYTVRLDRQDLQAVRRDGDVLHLSVSDGKDVVFGAFSFPRLEVESALALLEAGLASKQLQQQ